jgi:hypothetical protein
MKYFNPIHILWQLLSSLFLIVLAGWFGLTCLKLGWYAHEHPFWKPVLSSTLGLEIKKSNTGIIDSVKELLPRSTNEKQ